MRTIRFSPGCAGDTPEARPIAALSNFTPVRGYGYRIGLPYAGHWREILNTNAGEYGGSGVGNAGAVTAGRPPCLTVSLLPPKSQSLRLQPSI